MYLLSRTLSQGRHAGILSVLGVSTGTLVHVVFAAAGLSVSLAASATAFTVVKNAGAGYLIYLGIKAISAKSAATNKVEVAKSVGSAFHQGLITQALNPKVAAFMISYLPQFVEPKAKGPTPFLILGVLFFFVLDTLWFIMLVVASAKVADLVQRNEVVMERFRRGAGVVYIALGLNLLRARRAS